ALLQYQTDLTAGLFDSFLFTADYLNIQGEYAKRFAKNMVRYGLLGKHSKDITENSRCKERDLAYDTFETMLPVFFKETRLRSRTITHFLSAKKKTLLIESINEKFKKFDDEYTGPSQTTRMRIVLYSRLGPAMSQEKERNEAVLVWLLLNMGGSSMDIQYSSYIASDNFYELRQSIGQFTKENEKGACVYVEGVSLDVYYSNNCSLLPFFQLVPELSRLNLSITPFYSTPNETLSSFFSSITSCQSLKALKITGKYLETVVISILVKDLPNIEQLSFWTNILEDTSIDNLKKCPRLELLEIFGELQPSSVVQALVKNLPLLKGLSIRCDDLDYAAVESFEACKHLEKLQMFGEPQLSTIVQALVTHLSSLKELTIECLALEPAAAKSFKACLWLENLEIFGEEQPSNAVQELVRHLSSLRELCIMCDVLEETAAKSFQDCRCLEKLTIYGMPQTSATVQELIGHLSALKELSIKCQTLDSTAATIFKVCKHLEKLLMHGMNQPSTTIQALIRHLPFLKELEIRCQALTLAAAERFQDCTRLEKLLIHGVNQPSTTFHVLVKHLPNLKELTIGCLALDSAAAEGFQDSACLEKLIIYGVCQSDASFLFKILELLSSLQDLRIEIDTANLALADILRTRLALQILKLTVRHYTPGFMAHYLQNPLPSLVYLVLQKPTTANESSEEDRRAVSMALQSGMCVLQQHV
ncbi:hypothetical protein NECID01_2183, partial [Nematocida sp. AWRm77]